MNDKCTDCAADDFGECPKHPLFAFGEIVGILESVRDSDQTDDAMSPLVMITGNRPHLSKFRTGMIVEVTEVDDDWWAVIDRRITPLFMIPCEPFNQAAKDLWHELGWASDVNQ